MGHHPPKINAHGLRAGVIVPRQDATPSTSAPVPTLTDNAHDGNCDETDTTAIIILVVVLVVILVLIGLCIFLWRRAKIKRSLANSKAGNKNPTWREMLPTWLDFNKPEQTPEMANAPSFESPVPYPFAAPAPSEYGGVAPSAEFGNLPPYGAIGAPVPSEYGGSAASAGFGNYPPYGAVAAPVPSEYGGSAASAAFGNHPPYGAIAAPAPSEYGGSAASAGFASPYAVAAPEYAVSVVPDAYPATDYAGSEVGYPKSECSYWPATPPPAPSVWNESHAHAGMSIAPDGRRRGADRSRSGKSSRTKGERLALPPSRSRSRSRRDDDRETSVTRSSRRRRDWDEESGDTWSINDDDESRRSPSRSARYRPGQDPTRAAPGSRDLPPAFLRKARAEALALARNGASVGYSRRARSDRDTLDDITESYGSTEYGEGSYRSDREMTRSGRRPRRR